MSENSYFSRFSGVEIDDAVDAVQNPDTEPTAGSRGLVTSGGVAAALAGKEEGMEVSLEWPDDDTFLPDTMYVLGGYTGTELTLLFEDGESAEDMIYISLSMGAGLTLSFPGSNHIGLTSAVPMEGYLLELIGIWNPQINKWVFVVRRIAL